MSAFESSGGWCHKTVHLDLQRSGIKLSTCPHNWSEPESACTEQTMLGFLHIFWMLVLAAITLIRVLITQAENNLAPWRETPMPPGWLRPSRSKIASIVVSWPTPVIIGRLGMPIFRENSTTGPQPGMEQLELSRNDPTTFIWPISISKRAIISIWRQHAVEGLGLFFRLGARSLVSAFE